jgi:hypothetical protein
MLSCWYARTSRARKALPVEQNSREPVTLSAVLEHCVEAFGQVAILRSAAHVAGCAAFEFARTAAYFRSAGRAELRPA